MRSRLRRSAKRQQTDERAGKHEQRGVNPGADDDRKDAQRDQRRDPAADRAFRERETAGDEQADGNRREPALERDDPGTSAEACPEAPHDQREHRRRTEEREEHDDRSGKAGRKRSDRHDHHHVGARRGLADAEHVVELVRRQPAVNADGQRAHFGIRGHAAANREQREVSEHARERRYLIHRPADYRFFASPRKPYHATASPPTTNSARGTDMCSRLTHTTVSARNTRSAAPDSERRPRLSVVAKMRPTAAGATPARAAWTSGRSCPTL